jgi:hypothetical protein
MGTTVMSYNLEDADYLKLWMYFQDRADSVKGAMVTTLTWTVGYAAALLGFIFLNLTSYDASRAQVALSTVVGSAAAAGLVVCLYAWFMLAESAKHIKANWDRADRCRLRVEGLDEIVLGGEKRMPSFMKIWNQLQIIVVLFGIAFVALLAWTWKVTPA